MSPKQIAILVTAVASLAVLSPLLHGNDSFPLSTYPMFSGDVSDSSQFDLVIGLDDLGERVTLSPQLIAATDEVIQAGSYVRREIRNGRSEQLCTAVLGRSIDVEGLMAVLVVTDTINSVRWYAGDTEPSNTVVHASCGVVE